MKTLPDLTYKGEWNNYLYYELSFWYPPEACQRYNAIFGGDRETAYGVFEEKEYLFFGTEFLTRVQHMLESTHPEEILQRLKQFYPTFEKIFGELNQLRPVTATALSDQEVDGLFRRVHALIQAISPFDQFPFLAEDFVLPKVKEELRGLLEQIDGEDDFNDFFMTLTMPTLLSQGQKEELSLLKIASALKEAGNITATIRRQIKDHTHRFEWLPVFAFSKPWDEKHFEEQATLFSAEPNLQERIHVLENYQETMQQKIDDIEKRLPAKPLWSEIMREFAFVRNEAQFMVSLAGHVLAPVYKEIQRRTKMSQKDMRYLNEKEISESLVNHKDFSYEITQRKKGVITIANARSSTTYTAREAVEILEKIYPRKPSQKNRQLVGEPACIGKAIGKVKVIRSLKDMEHFEKGEIFVTESTGVDYLPAMRKAGAIITSLGGITSHAAVVSRELGIPAIVGIVNIHDILKDGDMVEVDANRGTIIKL